MEKEIVNKVQEAQRVPYRVNPTRNMPKHIIIKRQRSTTQMKAHTRNTEVQINKK